MHWRKKKKFLLNQNNQHSIHRIIQNLSEKFHSGKEYSEKEVNQNQLKKRSGD